MNHHHRKTLHALFAHPLSANVDFKKVIHLLEESVQGFAVTVVHIWSSADHKRLFSFVLEYWRSILPNAEYETREYLTEREVHR